MKYYGANVFDFTPNLSLDNCALRVPADWGVNVQVARVYAHKAYLFRKGVRQVDRTGWPNPNMWVPAWYTTLDPDYGNPALSGYLDSVMGIGIDTFNTNYQMQFVFDTAFLGAQAEVVQALMTVYCKSGLPYNNTLCGTSVYCNFYASEAPYIHTYWKGQPINVDNDGSGYAARFGPYPIIPTNEFRRRLYILGDDIYADTVPLDVAAVNKTGLTKLTGLTSNCLNLTAERGIFFAYCHTASITLYYVLH